MIEMTRLGGLRFFVNADHIESVEGQPDTNIILTNGKRLIVKESIPEVVRKVLEYQRAIRSGLPPLLSRGQEPVNLGVELLGENLAIAKAD